MPDRLIAPLRFGVVQPNLYRGSYPREHNLRFLQRLGLKTIVSLTPEPLEDKVRAWAEGQGIQLIHLQCDGVSQKSKKKRGIPISYSIIRTTLEHIIDSDKSPIYVHCLNGSHVTCLVIACLRKLSFWSMSSTAIEFLRYSDMEIKDETFIQEFRSEISRPEHVVSWIYQGLSEQGVVQHHPTLKLSKRGQS